MQATTFLLAVIVCPYRPAAGSVQDTCAHLPLKPGVVQVDDIRPTSFMPTLSSVEPYSMRVWETGDEVSRHIKSQRRWDEKRSKLIVRELQQFERILGRPAVLLDIGANLGWFSLLASAVGARVIAVEGSQTNAELLEWSLCQRGVIGSNVTLFKIGLGPSAQQCALVARKRNRGSPTAVCKAWHSGSASAASVVNTWGAKHGWRDYVVVGQMNVVRLDSLLQRSDAVDVIKIDVEGHEMEVAKGWDGIFDRENPPRVIFSEYVPSLIAQKSPHSDPMDYLRFFLRHGYTIHPEHGPLTKRGITNESTLLTWKPPIMSDLIMRKNARAISF